MAKETQGRVVMYTDNDGNQQMAIARYVDQKPEFQAKKKVFLRLIDDNYHFKKDENGKEMTVLKDIEHLTGIGMVD